MIQIERIEQVVFGQGERSLSRTTHPDWEDAFATLRAALPTLNSDHEAAIRSHPDTQIGPVTELVEGHGTAYSASVLYDIRVIAE